MRKYKRRKKYKVILLLITIILAVLVIKQVPSFIRSQERSGREYSSDLHKAIYSYLSYSDNRLKVYDKAAHLNNGSTANTCVYFISQVLRENSLQVPSSVCNTSQLISFLKANNWVKDYNYKDLKPGDICFTTDSHSNKYGVPTHTYVFMGWAKENSYDYAYVCDNQAKDYDGKIYHLRNIRVHATSNGQDKDPFSFFMYKDQ